MVLLPNTCTNTAMMTRSKYMIFNNNVNDDLYDNDCSSDDAGDDSDEDEDVDEDTNNVDDTSDDANDNGDSDANDINMYDNTTKMMMAVHTSHASSPKSAQSTKLGIANAPISDAAPLLCTAFSASSHHQPISLCTLVHPQMNYFIEPCPRLERTLQTNFD